MFIMALIIGGLHGVSIAMDKTIKSPTTSTSPMSHLASQSEVGSEWASFANLSPMAKCNAHAKSMVQRSNQKASLIRFIEEQIDNGVFPLHLVTINIHVG
jgi:hypothetical protein